MIPEREREALMRLTMCAREECGVCKYKDTCNFEFQYEIATENMNILADALRKTEPTISKMEQVDEPQIFICPIQNDYEALIEDEPQTETEIAKAIVHKMIDDAVIAEDAYPDLRQKMHDAVDEYEPQTDCAWK